MRDEYVHRKGLELDESVNLLDLGVSAWTGDNAATGALSVFLDLCKKGQVPKGSVLIVEHLDRLTRQHVRHALSLFFSILDAGITIVTLTPEREYTPEGSSDGYSLIEPLFLFANANEKSETLSKRLRDAWSEKRKHRKPLTSWTPAWIRMKDDKTGFELIKDKAEIVRKIVRLALDGYGDIRLVKKLNHDKVPVISDHPHWTHAYVSKILKTNALIGYYEPGMDKDGRRVRTGEVWPDYFPAVITMDEWYQLRAARQSRTNQRGPSGGDVANLFTGLLFNARDGQPFQRIVKNHARLISAAYRNGLEDGDTQSFPYEPFENAFLYGLASELKLQNLYADEPQQPSSNVLENLLAELADIDQRMEIVKQRIQTESGVSAMLDVLSDLDRRRKELTDRIEGEKIRQVQITKEESVLNDLNALARMWAGEHPDRADLRTRIKGKIRQLVKEMRMIIFGKKRSKFKTAQVQIFFKAGGSMMMVVNAKTNNYVSAELIQNSGTGNVIDPKFDFRLLHDPHVGGEVQKYVGIMEQIHQQQAALLAK